MKYTTQKEKQLIRVAFKTFLASRDIKFKTLCRDKGLNYNVEYGRVFKNNICQTKLNRLISLVDDRFTLVNFNGKFQILKG